MPLGSLVGKIQVVALVGLETQVGLRALPTKKECVVLRQPLCLQVPYEVGHVLVMVIYPLSTKKGSCLVSNSIRIEQAITGTYIH